jgi:peptidase S24-like protein
MFSSGRDENHDEEDKARRALGRRRLEAAATDGTPAFDLQPAVRDRLILRLDCLGVPARGRLTYVAALTGRAVQSVSRWFDPQRPGLPDVASLARLCDGLGCSADWVLGLTSAGAGPSALASASAAELQWAGVLLAQLRRAQGAWEPMQMVGDEMAPSIHDGDMLFVDRSHDRPGANGLYAMEIDGRVIVRRVENRIGTGIVFKCDNPAYEDYAVGDMEAAQRMGLRILGKVHAAVGISVFGSG